METQSNTPRLKEFGSWTEQTSSSGKRYYYNNATNVSQWDKPLEWKQTEKLRAAATSSTGTRNGGGQTPTDKTSPTSSTAARVQPQHSASSTHYNPQPVRPPVYSTTPSGHQVKADSSTSINTKLAAVASSTPNSASPSSAKRPRLAEDGPARVTSTSSSTVVIGRKPMEIVGQQQQVSSTTSGRSSSHHGGSAEPSHHHKRGGEEHRGSTTSSNQQQHHHHQQGDPPASSSSTANKRPFPSSSAERVNSSNSGRGDGSHGHSSHHTTKSPSKSISSGDQQQKAGGGGGSTSTAAGTAAQKPRPLMSISTSSLSLSPKKDPRNHGQQLPPAVLSNGTAVTKSTSESPNASGDGKRLSLSEKTPSNEGFREEKYQKYWRSDMATSRRALGTDQFVYEVKKWTDRSAKQTSSLFALDRDIHSIRTLDQTALLRTRLLKQRLGAVRQRIHELDDPKGQCRANCEGHRDADGLG